MKDKLKVYVVGPSRGYACWIEGRVLVDTIEEAELVLFTGGEDINPRLYGETANLYTHFNTRRDEYEVAAYHKALELGKPMWGTCRGIQLLCAMAGGKLIQDMDHNGRHEIVTNDGRKFMTNSLHHQMQYPFNMVEGEDYVILAWAQGLSRYHSGATEKNLELPLDNEGKKIEPEIVYYPKINAIGHQAHPEMMCDSPYFKPMTDYCLEILDKVLSKELIAA